MKPIGLRLDLKKLGRVTKKMSGNIALVMNSLGSKELADEDLLKLFLRHNLIGIHSVIIKSPSNTNTLSLDRAFAIHYPDDNKEGIKFLKEIYTKYSDSILGKFDERRVGFSIIAYYSYSRVKLSRSIEDIKKLLETIVRNGKKPVSKKD